MIIDFLKKIFGLKISYTWYFKATGYKVPKEKK